MVFIDQNMTLTVERIRNSLLGKCSARGGKAKCQEFSNRKYLLFWLKTNIIAKESFNSGAVIIIVHRYTAFAVYSVRNVRFFQSCNIVRLVKRAVYCFFMSARITEQTTASLVCAPRRNTMSVQFFFQVPDRLHDETAGRARNV